MRLNTLAAAAAAALCVLAPADPLAAQVKDGPTPPLTIESISVEPASPAKDTLCKLRVTLQNKGSEVASQLDFKVKINDRELPVYRNQLFMYPVAPAETTEIQLYNFWSTETSRPIPENGKLEIEVTLAAAQWTKITIEEDVEVWKPLGEVEGLPVSSSVTLSMRR